MSRYSSLLVSCPGAYANSGAGTGGLVSLHEGEATIIDRMDSMGLATHDGNAYRFVRSLHKIFGYDASGLRYVLNLPEARDIHDILIDDEQIVAVSTGENEVLRPGYIFTRLGQLLRRLRSDIAGGKSISHFFRR